MTNSIYDEIIVGQGLAGTALAWALRWKGRRILVVDRDDRVTSSRIAAGLMTPITGQRLVKTWRWDQFWPTAVQFYERVQSELSSTFFYPSRSVRLLATPEEVEFYQRRAVTEFDQLIACPVPLVNADWFEAPLGGFEMIQAGRLDVSPYLDASRRQFMLDGQFVAGEVQPDEIELTSSSVRIPRLGLEARRMIFCQGIDSIANPWFSFIRFKPAKGEILTLRIDDLPETRIVSRGVWLVRTDENEFKAGATYEWKQLDSVPTQQGCEEICSRLREFVKRPFKVIGHDAAVRPIPIHQYPILGLHPRHPELGFFNGLGSKGSLTSPWLAEHFASVLTGNCDLERGLDIRRLKGAPA